MDGPPPPPPPPPPPHGANPRPSSGLPPGNYDIFIIPPHSAGSGFLYLPSLRPHRNSFLAGVACTLLAVGVWTIIAPVLRQWLATVVASGGVGVVMLILGIGIAGWAWGVTQTEGAGGGGAAGEGSGGTASGARAGDQGYSQSNGFPGGPNPQASGGSGSRSGYGPPPGSRRHQYHQGHPHAEHGADGSQKHSGPGSAAWERAREETRKREEERKRQEELKRKQEEEKRQKEEAERQSRAAAEKEKWEKMRAREKEIREREARERLARERLEKGKDAKAQLEKEIREKVEAEERLKRAEAEAARLKVEKEKVDNERAERLQKARERAERERAERLAKGQATPPTFGAGERTNVFAGRGTGSTQSSPTKKYEKPTATSYVGTEDNATSFRPYDDPPPKRPVKTTSASSFISESSYAPSQSTARTTPPPSIRGPYSTADPDKVVIKAVYKFSDLFPKPTAQLVSGVRPVTDGLILRITTEGLFIDDDVRGVPQREWDVKAWTMKAVEVCCPSCPLPAAHDNAAAAAQQGKKDPFRVFSPPRPAPLSGEETDLLVEKLLRACKAGCCDGGGRMGADGRHARQTGEKGGLHVLRASIRDAEGRKYVFVLEAEEGWKVAVGLQRLRRGSQVRALAVNGLPAGETRNILAGLGWVS